MPADRNLRVLLCRISHSRAALVRVVTHLLREHRASLAPNDSAASSPKSPADEREAAPRTPAGSYTFASLCMMGLGSEADGQDTQATAPTLFDLFLSHEAKRKRPVEHYDGIPIAVIRSPRVNKEKRKVVTPRRLTRLELALDSLGTEKREMNSDSSDESDEDDDLVIICQED